MFGFNLVKTKILNALNETVTNADRMLEDIGWTNLSLENNTLNAILPKGGIKEVIKRAKIFYYNNPLAGHWVHLTTWFVFGEGVGVPKAKDKKVQEVIDEFWNNPDNKLALTSFLAQQKLSNKLQYEGNLFFALFDDEEGMVRVRIMNSEEIDDIVYDQDDKMRPIFYKIKKIEKRYDFTSGRYVSGAQTFVFYPDVSVPNPEAFGVPENKLVADIKIFHVKINNDINDSWGIPDLFRGLDWLRAHKDMAGDNATFIKALARFAWKKKVKGGAGQVNAISNALKTRTDLSNLNRPIGQTQVENQGVDTEPVKTPSGSSSLFGDGLRQMKLMVSAASGIFEHYYGDPSTGNLATAKSMELPMVKKFTAYQKLWEGIYTALLFHQINMKVQVGLLDGNAEENIKTKRIEYDYNFDIALDIDFPPILEADIKEVGEGLVIGKTNDFISQETAQEQFMLALNLNNIEEEKKKIEEQPKEETLDPLTGLPISTVKKVLKKEEDVKEADITANPKELPARGEARFKKKNNFLTQRINAYAKSLNSHYKIFQTDIKRGITSAGTEGQVVGTVKGLDGALNKLAKGMKSSAKSFFPEAVDIGKKFAQATLKDMNIIVNETLFEVEGGDISILSFNK